MSACHNLLRAYGNHRLTINGATELARRLLRKQTPLMPELPEVEMVRQQIAERVEGRRVKRVQVVKRNYFFLSDPSVLRKHLPGRTIETVERKGKQMRAHLDDGSALYFHLGMTGQISATPSVVDKHTHVRLTLEDGVVIYFRDPRKFGKIEYIKSGVLNQRWEQLGPDALLADNRVWVDRFKSGTVAIKQALLDQKRVSGVGNIYADEALWRTRLHPLRSCKSLTDSERRSLGTQSRRLLREAVKNGGSTINNYIQPDGKLGGFQNFHRVYGKKGEPCSRCQAPIQRIVVQGRSTHYCAVCQEE